MKILVIHPGSLGDVILSLPALQALRKAYPPARLDMIGNPSVLELLRDCFYADSVISMDRADVSFCLAGHADASLPLMNILREYTIIVNWLPGEDGEFSRNLRDAGVNTVLDARPVSQKSAHRHRIQVFLDALSALKIPTQFTEPNLFPGWEDKRSGKGALLRVGAIVKGKPLLAIHPGSGGHHKCWDFTRFVEVAHQARERLGFWPLFILGPAEEAFFLKLKASLSGHVSILKDLPLPVLAGALSFCHAYLGNDSGVTHLTAALNIPTLALFGPTDPSLWGPVGRKVMILCKREESRHLGGGVCQGCGCLDRVSVEDVLQSLSKIALDYSPAIC